MTVQAFADAASGANRNDAEFDEHYFLLFLMNT